MRYTECRLQRVADELLSELGKKTVAFRPNYDGQRFEPVVLPARFPNLLVNGSQGIAVGMATAIPPHNLSEVVKATIALIDDADISIRALLRIIRGPDFPTGGELVSGRDEIVQVYETGTGSLKLRGEWNVEESDKGNPQLIITSIPYAVERCTIVEKIAEVIIGKKLPMLLDVRDESAEDCRIVCEFKKGADPQLVAAYLYKHTPLQVNIQVNLTCLVPTEDAQIAAPERLDLKSILKHFLTFRMEVVTKRLAFDRDKLRERIHVLEGFAKIFDALDETIRIIRRSEDKADAADKLIKRFELDADQVDAILELKLYRLARLQILLIEKELGEKRTEAARLDKLLSSDKARWNLIRAELHELESTYQDRRRTRIVTALDEPKFEAEAFIIDEDAMVVLTQQGWVKRQQRVKDIASLRVRDGDGVLSIVAGSTKASVAFFSSLGSCYVARIVDVAASAGYGVPIQTMFKMADGERILAMLSFDPRILDVPPATEGADPEPPLAVAVTKSGLALRFSLRAHRDPSTRSGRRFVRLVEGDDVVYVGLPGPKDHVACVTTKGQALICKAKEVTVLAGAGKGVMLIKLEGDDTVAAAAVLSAYQDEIVVEKDGGTEIRVSLRKYEATARGGKGHALWKRGSLARIVPTEPVVPELTSGGDR